MDEYYINNMEKLNPINYMNIDGNNSPKKSYYKIKKIQKLDYTNPLNNSNNLGQKVTISQRNLSKVTSLNPNHITHVITNEKIMSYKNNEYTHNIVDNSISYPIPSNSLYQPRTKNTMIKTEKKNSKPNFSKRKIFDINNNYNSSYNYSYINTDSHDNTGNNNTNYNQNEMILKDKNIFYEKQINDFKNKNNALLNKLNIYINNIKNKDKEINKLQQKNKILQIQLNRKLRETNNNSDINNSNVNSSNININSGDQLKDVIYKSKQLNLKNKLINYKVDNNLLTQNNEYKNLNLNIPKNKMKSGSEANINDDVPNSKNIGQINIKKTLEQKNYEIKTLYQKLNEIKKDIELLTLKNSNLSKLLTKKNLDLIGYQKTEIEREKKIEQLTSLLFQQSYSNQNISKKNEYFDNLSKEGQNIKSETSQKNEKFSEQINFLKKEIKSKNNKIKEINDENEEKNKQIDKLVKKINDLEIDIKGMKSEEKQNFFDIKKYKNDILIKESEIKEISKKLHTYKNEKNSLLNDITNKEEEINLNKNKIMELNKELEENKKLLEQKNIEITKYINNNKDLIEQLKNNKDNNENKNKEDNILLKRIEELSGENNKLLNQINTINSKYYEQKKILNETNKKLQDMQEISISLLEKEKLKLIETQQKNNLNPEHCAIITNKCFKNLTWYLIYKRPLTKKDNNNKDNKSKENEENNYDNYFWVTNDVIKNDDLKKFNKFEDDNDKNKELKDYVINLQKKLEKKEENINKLDYQNKKLTRELLNKTANLKGHIILSKNTKENNFANSFNNNKTIENEINRNIFEKLNQREKHLNKQITRLKEQLNEKNNLENTFPHDMKNIDPHLHDSGFLDDDSDDIKNNNIEIQNFVSGEIPNINKSNELNSNTPNLNNNIINDKENNNEINENNIEKMDLNENVSNGGELNKSNKLSSKDDPFKESEKKVDEFLMNGAGDEDDYDEVKIITKQMNFLKEEIKDNREKNKRLGNEIKDLFFKIKCNDKNRQNIVQICQLLGFQPQLIDQIISNKKLKK